MAAASTTAADSAAAGAAPLGCSASGEDSLASTRGNGSRVGVAGGRAAGFLGPESCTYSYRGS
eukprot:scaffold649669_cov24-Prasinocladus_malaysianus.AAC.1